MFGHTFTGPCGVPVDAGVTVTRMLLSTRRFPPGVKAPVSVFNTGPERLAVIGAVQVRFNVVLLKVTGVL
jgi:hypothetical protein